MLKVEARVALAARSRDARQRPDRRQPHFVARHLRAQRAPAGALRRQGGARALAGRRPADPRTSARCSSSASGGATRTRSIATPSKRSPRGDVVAVFPEGTTTTAPTCCRSRARCCSRSSTRRATCSRSRSAIARRADEHCDRAGLRGRHDVSSASFWRRDRRARARSSSCIVRPALPAGTRASPRARARGRGGYPNGFG